jgi:predicted nucleic acid-binding protein
MALYVLDTDILTLYRQGDPVVDLRVRSVVPPDEVVTTVITAEEQITGWYALLRQSTRPQDLEHAYTRLVDVIRFFTGFPILPFARPAIARYGQLTAMKLNVRKYDLRIAAITMENGAVVVTRDVRDFGPVPGLPVEDWSIPPGPAAAGS